MEEVELVDPNAPIDKHSDLSLRDFTDPETVEQHDSTDRDHQFEAWGIFLHPTGAHDDSFCAQLDGHLGTVENWRASEIDDVLELVDDLVGILIRWNDFQFRGDLEGLAEWAGRMHTDDPELAERQPDVYQYIPENARERVEE